MILLELFWSFCKIGFTSFGGLSMVPLINSEMLSHGWMTLSEVSDIVAIAEMTPGPLGLNCATFAGTFGYRSKRSWLVFLLVNLVTQGGFAVYLAVTVLNHGVSGWSLIFYIPIEVIITLVELLLYRRLLTEKNKARTAVYAIAANLCSAVLGLWLIDPLWHFIVSIS